ncbi:PQQ-binding-like beta-propeller repeat protein, partial [Candidatus Woesearchaeota archaeon]|nr:PQQ-binding-like beta-propeller repeat protein [Candidatus Woesearchaeota archaeon]
FEKWSYNTKSSILTAPSVAKDKIIAATMDGRVLMLDASGNIVWEHKVSGKVSKVEEMFLEQKEINAIYSQPTYYNINGVDVILVGSDAGIVTALNLEGKQYWKHKVRGAVRGKVIFCNQRILFGATDGNFYCLDIDGKLVWKYNVKSRIESSPACYNNRIYFGANNGVLYCLDLKGALVWSFKTGGSVVAEPLVTELFHKIEYLLVGSTDNNLYCLDLDGKPYWVFETEGRIMNKVAVADINKDGEPEIVFGSCDNNVYAINNKGKMLWSYETDFWVVATPLIIDIDGDGRLEVIAGSYDNTLYVLDGEGSFVLDYMPGLSGIVMQSGHYTSLLTSDPGELVGKKVWEYQTEGIITGNAVLDSQIIVSTKAGKVDDIAYTR